MVGLSGSRPGRLSSSFDDVHSYVHLGNVASLDNTHVEDIHRRKGLAEAVFGPLLKRLLFNPWLEKQEKTRFLQIMVLNRFCHGAGLWKLHTRVAMATFRAAYMSFVRRSVRPISSFSSKFLTNEEACTLVSVLQPDEALHAARYRQLAQLVASQSDFVWGTLVQEKNWLDEVTQSLAHIAQKTEPIYEAIPGDDAGRYHWFCRVRSYSHDYKNSLRHFCNECLADGRAKADTAMAKACLVQHLELHGALVISVQRDSDDVLIYNHAWEVFGGSFADARALAAHRSIAHGLIADASAAAIGTACECCRLEFWTRDRLRRHLNRSKKCLSVHLAADFDPPGLTDSTAKRPASKNPVPGLLALPRFGQLSCRLCRRVMPVDLHLMCGKRASGTGFALFIPLWKPSSCCNGGIALFYSTP